MACQDSKCFRERRRCRVLWDGSYIWKPGTKDEKSYGKGGGSATAQMAAEKASEELEKEWDRRVDEKKIIRGNCEDPDECACAFDSPSNARHTQVTVNDQDTEKDKSGIEVLVKVKVQIEYMTLPGVCHPRFKGKKYDEPDPPDFPKAWIVHKQSESSGD